ncbi:MAG: hypothetical protein RMK91_06775 [Pseudanabaenaceae cyanobacterium SKYGB_i_bin29]|nr:hypothetical protein [Pseudanabaenaceae cyanobacterium SKYG29]MDW8421555.1 hypothetical protein [Pseudanabaenaceae cyanobacterium SKYGB_i_bin29]
MVKKVQSLAVEVTVTVSYEVRTSPTGCLLFSLVRAESNPRELAAFLESQEAFYDLGVSATPEAVEIRTIVEDSDWQVLEERIVNLVEEMKGKLRQAIQAFDRLKQSQPRDRTIVFNL